jgi:formyl-CoA transferase
VAGRDDAFAATCRVMGREDLIGDERFKTQAARGDYNQMLLDLFSEHARDRKALDLCNELNKAGVPAGVVNTLQQTFDDPQSRHRGLAVPLPHPAKADLNVIANPLRFSDTPATYRLPPPMLGQHTEEVLRDLLGMDEATIAALRAEKVI